MHAKEWELRVWHGVYQPLHEMLARFLQRVVLAPERYDPQSGIDARHLGDDIRVQTSAVDERLGLDLELIGL